MSPSLTSFETMKSLLCRLALFNTHFLFTMLKINILTINSGTNYKLTKNNSSGLYEDRLKNKNILECFVEYNIELYVLT